MPKISRVSWVFKLWVVLRRLVGLTLDRPRRQSKKSTRMAAGDSQRMEADSITRKPIAMGGRVEQLA